ncbi:MAG TPA: alpha/beta hydrolase [Thermomicrobiales bacterium]|nr:alpha/beta hydrolase [Thermomicrobiales bacterium]
MPKVVVRSGLKLHYQQVGEGPDVVMIHGLTGNLAVWHLKIIPLLWDRYRITTYDLRGHGYSEITPTGYTADDMAADLRDLLDALEIDRPALVGHSYGADISLYFAHHYPDRVSRVVAIEAALPAMIYDRERDDWAGWDYWTDVLARSGHTVPPERRTDVEYLFRLSLEVPKKWGPLNGLPRNPKPFLRLLEETSMAEETQLIGGLPLDEIGKIQTPVVQIYSDRSAFLGTYDYLREHLPNVRSILLPRSEWGHFGPLEQPELVAEQILDALSSDPLSDVVPSIREG